MSQINLSNYFRTKDTRYLKALIHHKEGPRSCNRLLYPGKIEYCPREGRDRKGEPQSSFEMVNLLMDSELEEWKIRSVAVSRKQESEQEYGGNRVYCIIDGKIKGIGFSIPTQLFNIEIGPEYQDDLVELEGKPVDPVIRMLEQNPGSIKYYGVAFAPYPFSRKPKPFTNKLIDFRTPGIASIGIAVPKYRCIAEELVKPFRKSPEYLTNGLKIDSVTVPDYMETSGTLGIHAAYEALRVLPKEIRETNGAVLVGTESPDHKVKGIGTIIQEMMDLGKAVPNTHGHIRIDNIALTSEFACVPAWMCLPLAYSAIMYGWCDTVVIIGSDVAAGAPGHPLDLDTGAMGGAIVVSRYNHILTALDNAEYNAAQAITTATSDESDFQNDQEYPDRLIGAYSLKPFNQLQTIAVNETLRKLNLTPDQIKVVAPHTPNGNSPYKLMRGLGFAEKPLQYVLEMVKNVGNTYSAAVIGNLYRGVELMEPGDIALAIAYGSTAGAVAAGFRATKLLPQFLESVVPTQEILNYRENVTYADRLFRKKMVIMH